MQRQKTLTVHGKKIKIVTRTGSYLTSYTTINGVRYFCNWEIMKDYIVTKDHKEAYEEFCRRSMDYAYAKWVKEFGTDEYGNKLCEHEKPQDVNICQPCFLEELKK